MHRAMLLLALLASAAPPSARAGTRDEGELMRIMEDLEGLAERQVWNGVDRNYVKLLELEDVAIPRDIHLTGAAAARALGDMNAAYERLERANAIERTEEVDGWLQEIRETYAKVELVLEPARSVALSAEAMPFDPSQRQTVERAIEAMREDGYFLGLLPEGVYYLGGERFEVTAGVDTRVDLSMKELRLQKRRRDAETGGD